MLKARVVVAAIVLGFQPVGLVAQGQPTGPAQAQPPGKPAPATGDALTDKLLGFFGDAARTGLVGFDPAYDAFSAMLAMAKQSLAAKRIDQRFFDRYERLLRVAALCSIPEKAGLLLPVTGPEIAAFVHDVTGSKLEGASGDLGKISDALTTEALRLKHLGGGR
jgi:hypothetical protein